jgi:glucose-6-phosphate 1-dehydrogenase
MFFWAKLVTRVIAGVMSLLDATELRHKLYAQREEHEVMWTALDDIARMHKDTPAGEYAKETLKKIGSRYGR